MATIKNGILGGFTGKVGSVIGYRTYGEDRMRSISERTAPATAAELKNRKQFKLVQDTLNCIKSLIKIGFKDYWTKTGGTRGAISYNKTHAVQVKGEDCFIDPERFRFSGGVLPGLKDIAVELERPDLLRFNWSTTSSYEASPKDQVMLLAIDLEGKEACYESLGNFRSSGTDVLNIEDDLRGKEVDIYIAVVAKDRSKQSDSQYLGRMIIPALEKEKIPALAHKEAAIDVTIEDQEPELNISLHHKPIAFSEASSPVADATNTKPPADSVHLAARDTKPIAPFNSDLTAKNEQVISSDIKISGDQELATKAASFLGRARPGQSSEE
ncbi:DUF6266 family protein [Pedobacter caeni]|uniref:Uncharacterized protein n=1 Tax=Pedobacter caeni TaxID=288992 RepID=A0A1M4U6X8_9SPHI|nr:DUF6266 family protein [Pedobacter caeni]SHE52591.1 hypothetical protein SAMN04488522_101455 [Pedobacter caeni]